MRPSVKKDTEPGAPVATDDAEAQLIHSPHKETLIWASLKTPGPPQIGSCGGDPASVSEPTF